jgi:hypothetical protein
MADPDEQRTREAILNKLATDPDAHLCEYTNRFGNVLNADKCGDVV